MKNRSFIAGVLLFWVLLIIIPSYTNASVKADRWQKIKAWNRYKEGDYHGALRIYRLIYDKNKNDSRINYRIGLCHFALQDMENALVYLDKAVELGIKSRKKKDIPPRNVHFVLGQAHHYLGDIDKALYHYGIYQRALKGHKLRTDPVNELMAQCSTAIKMMANPVNVKIMNLGSAINSEYDDGAPSITADGKTLIFTSRRPDTKGGGIDPNTGNYYDDIYISNWNEEKRKWSPAEGAPGNLNTEGHDACLSISPDGQSIFVYRNIEGVTGSGDIFISTLKNDKWSTPKSLPRQINSSFFESSACLSPDGKTLFFVSERPGGYGNADIWTSKKIGRDEWEKPKNLGNIINTEYDELGVFLHPDGKTLFFTSKGHGSMGGYDVFVSRFENNMWSKPLNLGYPINTTKDELHFTLTADGRKAYISSRKPQGLGGADIYEIDLTNYEFPIEDFQKDTGVIAEIKTKTAFNPEISILKGQVVDSDAGQAMADVEIFINDAVTDENVVSIVSDELGNYFITLKGDREYLIYVNKNGYKNYLDKISLPLSNEKTFTLVKTIVLERLKN